VRPDQADDRSLGDVEVDAVDREQAPEALRDAPCLEQEPAVRGGHLGAGHSRVSSVTPVFGGSTGSVGSSSSGSSSSAAWSSARRRWLGKRPSGRNSIIKTRAMPNSRYWYFTKSMFSRIGTLRPSNSALSCFSTTAWTL